MDLFIFDYFYYFLTLYWVISITCLFFPNIISQKASKKKTFDKHIKNGKVINISHRGGSRENFENTFKAFEHSVKNCNAEILELDIQITKDKILVLNHDDNLKRTHGVE